MNDSPEGHTVPTELERADAFVDGVMLAATVLATWWLILQGWGWWSIPIVILVALNALTGESFGDVQVLGGIATGLRNKLGLRRAHEWLLAYEHYYRWTPRLRFWTRYGCRECHAAGRHSN